MFRRTWSLTVAALFGLIVSLLLGSASRAVAQQPTADKFEAIKPILKDLGVTLQITKRPAFPKTTATSVEIALTPQVAEAEPHIVSFGLPFGPDTLSNDQLIRVTGEDGKEIAAFTKPLAHWGIDGKLGSIRSVLIQFEMAFPDKKSRKVVVTWTKGRAAKRGVMTPTADTQVVQKVDGFDFHCPKVLATLPADWLCNSLLAWQQIPAKENKTAPWFDEHLVQQFPGSLKNIATKSVEAHLYDRPATYAKIYVRHGEEKYLLAALKSNDFYIQHLGKDGFFDLKPGDHKYVYVEGSTIMYLLTGDERYKQTVERELISWAKWRVTYNGTGFWTERHAGSGLAAYLHAYELSGDPKHLDIARRYFEGVLAMQLKPLDGKAPDGAWVHRGQDHGDGSGWTTSPWMSALMMDSIWKLWMHTDDPRCAASMAMYAKFLEKYAVLPDGKSVYYMANSPDRGRSTKAESPPHNVEACYNLSLGYYLSGGKDNGLLKKIETLWPPVMKDGANSPGRKFNWRFRETSMLVWFLANANDTATKSSLRDVMPLDRDLHFVNANVAEDGEPAAAAIKFDDIKPILKNLDVTLATTKRPAFPHTPAMSVEITLNPQADVAGQQIVSFGLPLPPDALKNDQLIRVRGEDGKEIATFTKPLVRWGIDGKPGSIRSVLIQFEAAFTDRKPRKVVVTWDKERTAKRAEMVPIANTERTQKGEGFEYQCPKVLAIMPPDFLCASLVAWQQVPAKQDKVAPWFEEQLTANFEASLPNINHKDYEAHLYDRPATYAKIYVRYGDEKYLLAMLQAADVYIQHLGKDGFSDFKPGDHKYVYSEGSAIAYMLTGDERFKQAIERGQLSWAKWTPRNDYPKARMNADGNKTFWTERHCGFGVAYFVHAYEILGDPKLLDMARQYYEVALRLQVKPLDGKAPDGAWVHRAEDHEDGNGWTTSLWMSAILLDGIWKLWMNTDDPRCAASMAMYAKFTSKYGIGPDGKSAYYMANSPERGTSFRAHVTQNVRVAYILAMGYYLSGGKEEGWLKVIDNLWPPLKDSDANNPRRQYALRFRETSMLIWFIMNAADARSGSSLREMNPPLGPDPRKVTAIVGAQLIDGRGGPPVADSVVLVRGGAIVAVGTRLTVKVPEGAEVIDATGCSLTPGLIDSHFHIERLYQLPQTFLTHGITSLRDPGEWTQVYDPVRKTDSPMPRFFLTGPHLDCDPPAHPGTSFVVKDATGTRDAVTKFIDEGGSAIKVYYRLPPPLIKAATDTAHARGVPVTAHLEIVDADIAIRNGLDGVEHITSFGTALADPKDAERFRAAVTLDNRARNNGRYELWGKIDLDKSPRVKPMLDLMIARKTVVSPTLAVFELRRGDKNATEEKAKGYDNMLKFVGMCYKAGLPIVVGSHSEVPHAKRGWAYQRELELLVECGLKPMDAIVAGTRNNAAFFGVSDRLGTIEPGKLADLVLIDGDPLKNISAMREVKRVMLNGRWVPAGEAGK